MKKLLIPVLAMLIASQAWAVQQDISTITTKQSRSDMRTAVNTELGKVQANTTELYSLAIAAPWLAQATAPSITNVFWVDTSETSPVIKYWDGDSWEVAASGEGGTYTLPVATSSVLGGVKQGDRVTIAADGTISADVQTTDISGKEDSLGNPSTNGYVLSSLTDGTRSWIEMTGGGTGIAHATSDGEYYASYNGGWASLTGLYAPALTADQNYASDSQIALLDGANQFKLAGPTPGTYGPTYIQGGAVTNLSGLLLRGPVDLPSASTELMTIDQNGQMGRLAQSTFFSAWDLDYTDLINKPTLGTAAALDHGTSIGNIVRIADDGGGNPALPFALDLSVLTDTTGILTGKLAISDIDDTPVNGETAAPISSNYMYDHVAAADPHSGYVLESALGSNMGTFLATPSSANLRGAITDESGTGSLIFAGGDIAAATATTATAGDNDTSVATTAFVQTAKKSGAQPVCAVIPAAVVADDYPIFKAPAALTIIGGTVRVYAIGGTNVVGGLDECTGTNGTCSSVTAVDADITGTAGSDVSDDGTLANGAIASGNWIQWHTTSVSGTNTSLSVCFSYTLD